MAEFKLGRLRFVWKGAWVTGTSYVRDDIIRFGANSYVCVSAHIADDDFYVDFDTAKWELMTAGLQWRTEPWTTETYYAEGDVVRNGGKIYVAVDGHESAANFYTDFDAGEWQLFADGIQWQTTPWTTQTVYKEGDLVRHGGKVFICVDGHTAAADFYTDFDAAEWQLFTDGIQWKTATWTPATVYKEGDLVRYGGRVYICVDGHTAGSGFEADFNANEWQLFADGTQWVNAWTASTLYKVGDIARVSGKTYICVNEHTANATQRGGFYSDISNWNLYADGNQYRGAWDTTAYYSLGDFVRYGAKTYVCVLGHEADADFYVDFDATRWNLFNDGQQWLSDWDNGVYYKEGDIVIHGGTSYICVNGHASDSSAVEGFDRDLELNVWDIFSVGYDWKSAWTTGTYYKLNDIVRYGAKAFICVDGHVAAADFYTDVDATRWELLVDGQQWQTTVWTPSTLYKEGDLVRHGGKVFICVDGHTAASDFYTDLDAVEWQLFSDGIQWQTTPWTTEVVYKEGDLVRYGGRVYICVDGHTSTSSENRFDIDFDAGDWQLFADGTQWKTTNWTAITYYKTGDIVKYGAKTYVAIDDHLANATQDGGFYVDLAASRWQLYADGVEWQGDWTAVTYYKLGDIVRYDGNSYVCNTGHTSAADGTIGLEADLGKWDVYAEGFKFKGNWDTDTKYNINDVVKFGGSLYICVNYHTSVSNFEEIYWNILIGGLEFEDSWSPVVEYQIGDIVTYGGYSYVANTRSTSRIPPSFPADWELLTTGFKVTGDWSQFRSYKVGEVVRYGGNSYVAILETTIGDKPTNEDGSTSILWQLVTPGFNWRGTWTDAVEYRLGDTIGWASNSYVCVLDHTSEEDSLNQPDLDSLGIYWQAIAEGGEGNKLARRGDLLTRDASQNKRLPRGLPGQVLQVSGRDVVWDYFNVVDNVFYVAIEGIDSPERGTSLQTAFRTLKYASEYILADQANRTPATIFVKTGTFREELPIVIPANVAVVGDELRSTRIEPALGRGVESVTVTSPGVSYNSVPTVIFQTPQTPGGFAAEGIAVLSGGTTGTVTSITVTKPGSGYTSAPLITIAGGDPSTIATATSTLKEKLYSATSMFYMRDGSGLRNCTVAGLTVELGPVNQYLTRRPETDCFYTSLDPGFGPGDESVWIVNRSPYVQNVTTFGNGAVGMKVDGALHNGGAKTIVCNDFTQVISDGIGIWCTNQGRSECVSVFTYYAHLGYLSEDGGVIRGTNGNCSYGTFGVSAEGVDPSEVSRIATVDNRREEALVINTFVDGDGIVVLEYLNAGENYQAGNTTFEVAGSGVANSIVINTPVVQNGGVKEVRVLAPGASWLAVTNNAQTGNDVSIRLSASDVQSTNAYEGERAVLIDGQGVGQYGYVVYFNGGTKQALIAKESFAPLTATGTSSVNNRVTVSSSASLAVDQAIAFSGTLFGGLDEETVYYVKAKPTGTAITIYTDTVLKTEVNLTTGSGSMAVHGLGWESLYAQPIETILDTTTRYSIEPRVVFSTGEGASATGVISPGVSSTVTTVTTGGYYQAAPSVIISGTQSNATGAEATATIIGSVEEVRIRQGGTGFTGTPTVQFIGGGLPPGSINHAAGTAVVTGKITSVAVTNGGSGYDVPPEVIVTGSGYNGDAYLSAKITNIVGAITVSPGGAFYTTVPTVAISGGGGQGATAVANLAASVTGFQILEGGSGYSIGTTTINIVPAPGDTAGGGATATVIIDNGVEGGPGVITGITLVNAGSNYTKPPLVLITSSTIGTDAAAVTLIQGSVVSFTITNGGSGYVVAPNVTLSSGATTGTAIITGSVFEIEVINGGTGFTGSATLQIIADTPGAGATAVATVSRVVESVTLSSPGTGYTSPPTVAITGGGGTGALASSVLNASLNSVTITRPGSGYVTTPTVTFAGGHNFKSILAGESYYRNASALVAISDLQITETLAAMEYIKTLANAVATNTDPAVIYQNQIIRTGTATAPAGAYAQTAFWIDVVKAISQNGGDNSTAAALIEDNRPFIIAEAISFALANDSGAISYTEADLRKRIGVIVDALAYDLSAGTAERTVSIGERYGYLVAGQYSFTQDILDFVNDIIQDIIVNNVVIVTNSESAVQVFAELLASEITAPTAVANLINLIKTIVDLNSTLGATANSTYTDLLLDNTVWIQAEVTEYIKATFPDFEYNQALCGRDVGLIVKALAHDVRFAESAIPSVTLTTTNVLSNINVVNGGNGYGQGTTVSFSGDLGSGTSPAATPIINSLTGAITGFTITQPGSGFSVAPSVVITIDTGSGAFARVLVLGQAVQEFRIIRPGSGYLAPPFVKLVDPNNTTEGRYQVRIGNGVLDQPIFTSRGEGYLAARTIVSSPTGFADNFQVGEFVYVDNLTNVPTPGANIQFSGNDQFYKLVTIRELTGDSGILGGRSLIISNRSFVQEQVIAYVNATYPTLDYNEELCKRDVGLIVDAVVADIFGDTERGIEAGKSYYRSVSSLLAITGDQLVPTLDAIDKIEEYLIDIVQNIAIPRNQLLELQVLEPTITGGNAVIPALRNTIAIVVDIINNGTNMYLVQDLLLDNKSYIQAEVMAFINTTYPEFTYNQDLCRRDVGLIVDALAYDLFAGFGQYFPVGGIRPGSVRSREAGLRYYSSASSLIAITDQLEETLAAINYIAEVALSVVNNDIPTVVYQTEVEQVFDVTAVVTLTLEDRIQDGIDEIINIINNGVDVLPQGTYSARLQISPLFTVDNVPNHDTNLIIRSKYSQVRISAHDFLNIGTGNKAATNYPGIPVNAPEVENEVLESGGGRCFYTSTDQDGNFRVGELFRVEQSTGIATLNADAFNLSGLNELSLGGVNLGGTGATITEFSTDSTFLANSDTVVPTQRAIRTYISSQLGSGGGNLAVNAITAGDIQITATEISTNADVLDIIVPAGVLISETVASTDTTTGSLVVDGGVGIAGALNVGGATNIGGNLVVTGDLTVNGNNSAFNVGTLSVEDINITIANGAANAAAANGAGITVAGPTTPATILYSSADDRWNFNKIINAPSIQSTPIGTTTTSSAAFTSLSATTTVTFNTTTNNQSYTTSGAGTITITSGTLGTINNMSIGATTRSTGAFTTLTSNGATTFTANTTSSGTSTGTLVVTGGVGISENLNVGGSTGLVGLTTSGTTTLSPANAPVAISPTGTGSVTISPATTVTISPTGALTINPTAASTINNTSIGASTRSTGAFTTLTSNNATTFTANTSSTTTGNGTVVVTGGVGISENLNVGGAVVITGNLTVNGTTSTINSTTISVDDINITLGDTASPTDSTANNGGITLKGATDKTLNWVQSTGRWTSNQPFEASSLQNTPIGSTTRSTGAFTTLDANSTVGLSPASANVTISPSGTGTVTISPAGALTINPTTASTINNTSIGASTRSTGAFTTLTSNAATTFTANTASTTTTSGTLVVTGGVGISGDIYAGSIQNTPIGATTRSSGAFTTLTSNAATTFTANTASTTTTSGTLVVTGGVGVSGQVTATTLTGNHDGGTGSFTTLGASSTVTLSPANTTVTISPSGTGTVAISPAGALTINPATASTINNTSIGASTRSTGAFTTLTSNSATTFTANTASTTTTTGTLVVTGGVGVSGQVTAGNFVGGTGAFTTLSSNAATTFTANTASTTTTSGTLVVTGGVGVSGQVTATTLSGNVAGGTGSFTTLGASSTVTLSPANTSVTISPTGTGTVAISPAGALTINPTTASTINNTSIGASTRSTGAFTTLTSNGATTFTANTASTTTTSGTLVVTGGVGISGQLTATTIVETSSIAFKENVNTIDNALEAIMQLVGVTYDRKDNKEHEAGLIAEDVNKVLPDLVSKDANGDPHGIKYSKLTAYLIEAVKSLKQEIDQLKGNK
jgi:hypothetical protein